MRVTVIGSGAMGSLFGGLLAANGHEVVLVDIWEDHVRRINDEGLMISAPDGTDQVIDVTAATSPSAICVADLVVIFVKSIQTEEVLSDSSSILKEDVDLLTLQNGLGNPETIAKFVPEEKVIAGTTAHGSTLKGPGHVVHAGEGPTTIGRYFVANDDIVYRIADNLTEAGIETHVSDEVRDEIWEKVLVNIGINVPTALARVRNGVLVDTDAGNRLVEAAVREASEVARTEGVDVRDDIVSYVKEIAAETGANRSSMLQDIEAGRKTEIEFLTGSIVRRADRHDIPVPVNRTLSDLIRLAERSAGES